MKSLKTKKNIFYSGFLACFGRSTSGLTDLQRMLRIRTHHAVSMVFLYETPAGSGSGMGENSDPGSGINIPDPQHSHSIYLKHCMNVLAGWRDFLAGVYFVLDRDDN
jgi:hypothetical protein